MPARASVNLNRPVFDEPREYEGFRCLRARIGRQAGTEKHQQPDIIVRPDSGTIGLAERRPEGGGLAHYFRIEDAVGYIEGERAP